MWPLSPSLSLSVFILGCLSLRDASLYPHPAIHPLHAFLLIFLPNGMCVMCLMPLPTPMHRL